MGALGQCFSLPLAHIYVGVGGGESLTHGRSVDLKVVLVIESEVVIVKAEGE